MLRILVLTLACLLVLTPVARAEEAGLRKFSVSSVCPVADDTVLLTHHINAESFPIIHTLLDLKSGEVTRIWDDHLEPVMQLDGRIIFQEQDWDQIIDDLRNGRPELVRLVDQDGALLFEDRLDGGIHTFEISNGFTSSGRFSPYEKPGLFIGTLNDAGLSLERIQPPFADHSASSRYRLMIGNGEETTCFLTTRERRDAADGSHKWDYLILSFKASGELICRKLLSQDHYPISLVYGNRLITFDRDEGTVQTMVLTPALDAPVELIYQFQADPPKDMLMFLEDRALFRFGDEFSMIDFATGGRIWTTDLRPVLTDYFATIDDIPDMDLSEFIGGK